MSDLNASKQVDKMYIHELADSKTYYLWYVSSPPTGQPSSGVVRSR